MRAPRLAPAIAPVSPATAPPAVGGLRLAPTADEETVRGEVPPFIAVVPPAGFDIHHGDWVGIWENYLVQDVVPWVDAHLPPIPDRRDRTLGGLSSGGYGALDIG